ncbi:MAG TPA: HYR domain-containing protein [Myxococcaceae bacterium]|nr:HYR domain-containing protein [Myxococcaceae bacterium]
MPRVSLKSALTLLAVALLSVGASEPQGCSGGSPHTSRHHALPEGSLVFLGGLFFITGHAPDFHAPEDAGAARLLTKSIAYVRDGNTLPFLWVESRIAPPAGRRSGKEGLRSVGFVEGRDYLHLDAAQLKAQPAAWWDALSSNFSALVVASDQALLTQAEVDQLNLHRGDLSRFMKDLRGILAFAEGGVSGTRVPRDQYEFLPFTVSSTASAVPPFSVTTFGQQALGLAAEDVSSPAYNHFDGSFGFQIITISDSNGDIIAVAGRVELNEEYLFANAGTDETFYGPGQRIPVTLDGSGSITDPAAHPLRYVWVIDDMVVADTTQPIITVQLPPGVHHITLILFNERGEGAEDEVTVTAIRSSAAPRITCPANLTVPTAPVGVCGAPVSFPAPTVTAPNGVKSLTCTPGSGSAFALGNTQVSCTVVDQANQSATCSFLVTVRDQEPPTLVPPEPTTSEADAACQASLPDLSAQAQAADNCTAPSALVISQSPQVGTLLSAGPHTITFQVTDQAGNTTTASTTHTVVDVTPPTITRATPSKQTLWPPNHKMVPVTVGVTLSDNCGNTSGAQCRILRVTSNEPINGPGDGNTHWDWELLGPMAVNLRAERAGLLNSRIYTLWVECRDSGGQVATTTTSVTVPHDQRGR